MAGSSFSIAPAQGGVTAPEGFSSAARHCGIKASALDLAILAADALLGGRGRPRSIDLHTQDHPGSFAAERASQRPESWKCPRRKAS